MKIVKRISALFIGLALMVALPVTAHASTNDDQQDIASLDMSVIDVQIQSRGVMTAEDLYDFLQSDAEKTVDIDAETGKIIPAAGVGFQVRDLSTGDLIAETIYYPTPVTIDTFFTNEEGWLMLPYELSYGQYELIEVET